MFFKPVSESDGYCSPALNELTLLAVLNDGLVPGALALGQPSSSPLVPFTMVVPLLERPLILVSESELSEREVFLPDLLDSRVEVVSYMDALKLEVQNLC